MITISLTLNVQLDAADLAALDARLAALARGMARLTESAEAPQSRTEPTPSADLRAVSADSVNPDPKPQNALKRGKPTPRPPKTPAPGGTPVLPPVFPATINGEPQRREEREEKSNSAVSLASSAPLRLPESSDPPHLSNRLPFAEFDKLVRAEMKRLAMDGRLPGHKLWDSERKPPLPTLGAVILRYKADGLVGLAEMLGLEPPLSVKEKNS
jgi:hypothetical protein